MSLGRDRLSRNAGKDAQQQQKDEPGQSRLLPVENVREMEGKTGKGEHRPERGQGVAVAERQQYRSGQDDDVRRQPDGTWSIQS